MSESSQPNEVVATFENEEDTAACISQTSVVVTDECAICRTAYKLPVLLNCGHRYCFFCIKQHYLVNSKNCPLCRSDIVADIIEHPTVTTNDVFTSKWLYEGRGSGGTVKWWRYDEETSDAIEKFYERYQSYDDMDEDIPTFEVWIGNVKYVIDFDAMKQYRADDPSRTRKIRRSEAVVTTSNDISAVGGGAIPAAASLAPSSTIPEELIKGIGGIKIVRVLPPEIDDGEL